MIAMETAPSISEAKYQKLASEYSKLRAQASVLKKAVLEEQAKSGSIREQLRQHETSLRRAEQENDSLGFRNKQLEQRVAALQQEIAEQERKKKDSKGSKGKNDSMAPKMMNSAGSELAQDALIFEELQKKIMENAQLTSQIDDKECDLQLCNDRITSLEQNLEKRTTELTELERRLRREIETLQNRNSELETKLVEAASMLGSEDALSASGSENLTLLNYQQHHHNSHNQQSMTAIPAEERLVQLEKEVAHWRTQYEMCKMQDCFGCKHDSNKYNAKDDSACNCSSAAAGLSVKACLSDIKSTRDSLKEAPAPATKEQLIYNNFSKKYEDLLKIKCMAESRALSYQTEAENLQNCLENSSEEIKLKEKQIQSINRALQSLEEDLATTRINYEEQISVLTEQVIILSDQLAACK